MQDAKSNGGCLLSQELSLVTFNLNKITEQKSKTQKIKDKNVRDLVNKFPLAFNGVGKLKDHTVKLNIDEKGNSPCTITEESTLSRERQGGRGRIEKLGIIERAPENQPTPWVSPVAVVPKSDWTVRLCVDMRMANQAYVI